MKKLTVIGIILVTILIFLIAWELLVASVKAVLMFLLLCLTF